MRTCFSVQPMNPERKKSDKDELWEQTRSSVLALHTPGAAAGTASSVAEFLLGSLGSVCIQGGIKRKKNK